MDILKMTICDYEDAFKLWTGAEGVGLRTLDDSREGIHAFLQRNPNTNFICRDGGELVGTILSGNDGRRGYIYHAVVKSSHRRLGIGKRLVKEAVTALESEGINKVALVVFSDNLKGNAFWESIGFAERRDLKYRDLATNPSAV